MNLDHIASSVNDPAVINDPAEADPTEVSTDNSPDLAQVTPNSTLATPPSAIAEANTTQKKKFKRKPWNMAKNKHF